MSRQLDGASLIPNLLNSWIATYIGENSIDRSNYMNTLDNQVPPLFYSTDLFKRNSNL
ncbi:MAG: hypothetical protein IPH96_16190 [Saprospiraceae bacterium]|nr:hypothetical protein [Saprospiraceae bacterium]